MAITKELIQAKVLQLKDEREKHIANANACTGAIYQLELLAAEAEGSIVPPSPFDITHVDKTKQ